MKMNHYVYVVLPSSITQILFAIGLLIWIAGNIYYIKYTKKKHEEYVQAIRDTRESLQKMQEHLKNKEIQINKE